MSASNSPSKGKPSKKRKAQDAKGEREDTEVLPALHIKGANDSKSDGDAMLTKKERRQRKKQRKMLQQRVTSGRGSRKDFEAFYGKHAKAGVELKPDGISKRNIVCLKPWNLHNLILWVFDQAVSPKWVHVQKKPLITKVVVVIVDGLDQQCSERYKDELSAVYSAFHGQALIPFKLSVPASLYESKSVVSGLLECSLRHLKACGNINKAQYKARTSTENTGAADDSDEGDEQKSDSYGPEDLLLTATELVDNEYPIDEQLLQEGYIKLPETQAEAKGRLFAIDCEMVRTGEGLELARFTLLAHDGQVLVDKLVKPENNILDYSTRYSGITEEMLRDVTYRLKDAQADLSKHAQRSDILVGHSLENDLRALKVIHPRVIDTALLFPHIRGPPFKSSLKYLVQKYLGRNIQMHASGHCSEEDAVSALDLVKLKLRKGPQFATQSSQNESLLAVLRRNRKECAMIAGPDTVKTCAPSSTNVYPCTTDEEVVAKACSVVQKHHHLVVTHLRSLLPVTEDNDQTALLDKIKQVDRHVKSIFDACGHNTMFMLVTGQTSAKAARRLLAEKSVCIREGKRSEFKKEEQLKDEMSAMQAGHFFLTVKHTKGSSST